MKLICATLALLWSCLCVLHGQQENINTENKCTPILYNQKTTTGLKTGRWLYGYEVNGEVLAETGCYRIIPLSTYHIISELGLGSGSCRILYKGAEQLLFYSRQHEDSLSVKDDMWYTYYGDGRLHSIDMWDAGLSLWTRYFDGEGNLIQHDYHDYDNDTSFYLTYKNNQLFKKAYYPPDDGNHKTILYYPDNILEISNAEPDFRTNFLYKPTDTCGVFLTATKDITIMGITASNESFRILHTDGTTPVFPLRITPKDTVQLDILFSPTVQLFQEHATLVVETSDTAVPSYKLYCTARAAHVDGWNVRTMEKITLSKKNDEYVIIAPMGTVTDVYFLNKKGERIDEYPVWGITRIALSEFAVGTYTMVISSCHTGGRMELFVVE